MISGNYVYETLTHFSTRLYSVPEVLGAFAVIFMLWLLTGVLMYEAVHRIVTGHEAGAGHSGHVNADVMILTAGLSCAANIA